MKKMMIAKVATPKNTARIKKMITAAVTALCMGVMFSMTVFADGASVNTSDFLDTVETVLKAVCILIGAGLGVWGVVNLIEGYGNDNPGAKSQGMKQLMAGGGVALIGTTLVPLLSGLFG